MFVGSMVLAHAMEHVRLHQRLGLLVLRYVGSSIMWYGLFFYSSYQKSFLDVLHRSMAGLMSVTAFLSMWINNSAATNIMIPTAIAIVNELQHYQQTALSDEIDNHESSTDDISMNPNSEF